MQLSKRLEAAIEAHREGDTASAGSAYAAILAEDPDQPDALHFMGLLSYQDGRADDAIRLISRSLELHPANPAAHNNLGNILKVLERREEAAKAYIAALDYDANHADAWNNLGLLLRGADRFPKAIDAFREAVRAAPQHPEAWHNLGVTLMLHGAIEEAADAFEASYDLGERSRSPEMWLGQALCAAIRGTPPERAPDDYVRRTFDGFADTFDEVLGMLDYRAPQLVAAAVDRRVGDGPPLPDVVDLGCGTGLVGPLIRPRCRKLVGVDLSVGMLRKAKATNAYDHLVEFELVAFLEKVLPIRFDLAVCADTLCYFGALAPVMQALAPVLKPGGAMIATVEVLEETDGPGFAIDSSGRYAHSEAHLRDAAAGAGLTLTRIERALLRKELGREVQGLVFEVELPADAA